MIPQNLAKTFKICSVAALASMSLLLGSQTAAVRQIREDTPIRVDKTASIGESDAVITMIEFSDYQCPLSARHFNWTLRHIVDDYVKTGKLKYSFRDFPLESKHPLALKAAEAAHCAGEQGKFWEMHDRLMSNQSALDGRMLARHASMLGLDVSKFQHCLDSGKYEAEIRESVAEGSKLGVKGTPGFFLGLASAQDPNLHATIYIEGAQTYSLFKAEIDRLLSSAMRKAADLPAAGR